MQIILGDHYQIDVEAEAKELTKQAGHKIKEIDRVVIRPDMHGNIALQVWGKNHEFIASKAC